MTGAAEQKDTIPRLLRLVPHMKDQLVGLRNGATFEQARLRYRTTVDRLFVDGVGRGTASSVDDKDRYWAPTRDVLEEAMRLEFVERQQLPSARRYLDGYRHRRYVLTALGEQAADQAESDLPAFSDELAAAVYRVHPYFRRLIRILEAAPLACPELTEGEVEESRRLGRGTEYWIDYATDRLTEEGSSRPGVDIREIIVSFLRHRFGRPREGKPTNKEIKEAMNDALANAAVRLRGLSIGATDLKVLKGWGSQLRLLDQSRYVPQFEGKNVIWLAADLSNDGNLRIHRRALREYGQAVCQALVDAYRAQAVAADSGLNAPYLPIYRVRADAAFRCKVTRALVDLAIERLAVGDITSLGVQLWLHLGNTAQPPSEPVYRRGGNRRYEMTLQPASIQGERHAR